jgi:hypothetical protein
MDLADIITGGDGFGTGIADGIDPTTGNVVSKPAIGYGLGDMLYHPVESLMTIDGVFIPNGLEKENVITSAGHRFRFPTTDGRSYDLIRRGGTYDTPRLGGRPQQPGIPPIFAGIDYRTAGHSAIGMHANVGFTIDLHAVAYRQRGMRITEFKTTLANVGFKGSSGQGDFWVFIDGQMIHHIDRLIPKEPARNLSVAIAAHHRYLTLVSTDGGNGMGLDWITLGDPKLYLGPEN